jgi:hypothetical protein
MKYIHLLLFAGALLLILNITQCGGRICRHGLNGLDRIPTTRERSLLVTKHNPSALNKALDAL